MTITDPFLYGRSDYETSSQMPADPKIDIPKSATDVVLYRLPGSHHCRFSINTNELREWVEDRRTMVAPLNPSVYHSEWNVSDESSQIQDSKRRFDDYFYDAGWRFDPSMITLRIYRPGDVTDSIWHIPESGETFLNTTYRKPYGFF